MGFLHRRSVREVLLISSSISSVPERFASAKDDHKGNFVNIRVDMRTHQFDKGQISAGPSSRAMRLSMSIIIPDVESKEAPLAPETWQVSHPKATVGLLFPLRREAIG